MLRDEASPGYARLFGELDFRRDEDARSVYSPAAYLVDLLALMEANLGGNALLERRTDLGRVRLDAEGTFAETPYLDVVNEVLERELGPAPYDTLRQRRHPFALPFALDAETLRVHLRHLQVTPLELYWLFAAPPDHDTSARELLAMSPEDVAVVTRSDEGEADLAVSYGLAEGESLGVLRDAARFAEATGLSGDELRELVAIDDAVGLNADGTLLEWGESPPLAWLGWAHRFGRLARATGLSPADLGLAVTTFCAGRVDPPALRALAAVLRLRDAHDLTVTDVCRLAVPVEPDEVRGCSGDLLSAHNKDYRLRLVTWIDVAESEIATIVRRYREHHTGHEPGPFDRGAVGLAEIGLLHRAGHLASTLGVSADELFDVLDALHRDPSLRRYTTFPVIGDVAPQRDVFTVLAGGDPAESLWLAQVLFAVVTWAQAAGFSGRELTEVVGGGRETDDGGVRTLVDGLVQAFEQAAFTPELFAGGRFGERASKVLHDVLVAYDRGIVSTSDSRLLRLDPAVTATAAYDAVTDFGVVVAEDFQGLGLGERLQAKVFGNLVLLGHLRPDGTLAVGTTEGLRLASDFGAHRDELFKAIGAVAHETAAFFPADLGALPDLDPSGHAELYDNLVHNGYLEDGGDLTDPAFFLEPTNSEHFRVNADLADVTGPVLALLDERITRFAEQPLRPTPEVFAELRLTDAQVTALLASLVFNGHLDEDGNYRDKAALAALPLAEFGLAIEFYPRRREVLDAVQRQVLALRAELHTFTAEQFAGIADVAATGRVLTALEGRHLAEGRVVDEELFTGPEGTPDLGGEFPAAERDTVVRQIRVALADERPYRLDPAALSALGFTAEERDGLLAHLVESGHLTEGLAVTERRLPYFRNVTNAHDFALPGLEDYAKDVFFLLHAAADAVAQAVSEVLDRLDELANRQEQALRDVLADVFGVPQETAAAICRGVTGGVQQAFDTLVAPALTARDVPVGPHFRLAHRRIRRFALLAAKLGLDAAEVTAVFTDQDLAGKFPENLALPPGVQSFDALLESSDGTVLVFAGPAYWTYAAGTYALKSATPTPLVELSPRFEGLVAVDAAFTLPSGVSWIVGHTAAGGSRTFTRQPGGTRWAPREQTWGKVDNTFADPDRIDGAFADSDGRTYLFSGEQYIRYSSADYTHVDEGYPRPVAEWREREGLGDLPAGPLDAFQAPDGKIHVLTGATGWGRVRNAFEGLARLDAAHTTGSAVELYAGDQVVRYSDSVENPGVRADEGHPRRISGVPGWLQSGVDAAFTDQNGVLHLFKDGTTAAVNGDDVSVVQTQQRWGVLPPALPSGTVDAALAGLDGRTYLFSGSTYLRYSAGDYTVVDSGYPRKINTDWGGLDAVDAAFVLDGSTYLFGVGGLLFELAADLYEDVAARRLSPALLSRFAEHGLTPTRITGHGGAYWSVQTGQGLNCQIRRRAGRMTVHGDGSRYSVRYSTADYRTPDAGFPKPLSDNWWNVPEGFAAQPVDAVFTGRDNDTYLFSGNSFIRFDARHRWWSEPMSLREHWDSVPFDKVDAAFVGHDGRTYLFSGSRYARYSTDDYTRVDDRYPALIAGHWDNVRNNVRRTGRVDATLVTRSREQAEGADVLRTYTYLFSGDQYFRYVGTDYERVQHGYPRLIEDLSSEPGLGALDVVLEGVDAAFADRRTTYLFSGDHFHAVSAEVYRSYDSTGIGEGACVFVENGSVVVGTGDGWVKRSAIEGHETSAGEFRPRTLRTVPPEFRTGLDSVLTGADGNTYLFKGQSCFDTRLNRAYPLAEEWGRPRNTIHQDSRVDAAFVGRDGRTYLFSGDQFFVHTGAGSVIDGDPLPIAEHWGGLTSVALAFVRDGKTFLFEHPDETGRRRHVVYSGTDHGSPDEGYPTIADDSALPVPDGFPFPDAVLFEQDTMILLGGENCVSYDPAAERWSRVRPITRLFPGFGRGLDAPDGLRTAFTASDGVTHFFFDRTHARFADGAFGPLAPTRDRWGLSRNPFTTDGGRVDAAFVYRGEVTYLFSGDRYVRYTGGDYRAVDAGYPKRTAGNLRLEEPFANLPEAFDDALDRQVDAVFGNDRSIHLLVGGVCHTVSPSATATYPITRLGAPRNTIAETGRVDAALVADRRVYLLSGDQYVRYSSADYSQVDDGYPKGLTEITAELDVPALPVEFQDGVDAAFRGPDGATYLFRGKRFTGPDGPLDVKAKWGRVRNEFDSGRLDAALVGPTGELYAFAGDQFVRYAAGSPPEVVAPGFPRTIEDDWGDLPDDFESGVDGAFGFEGRAYLTSGRRYVRYSGDLDRVDRTFPQEFRHRWSGTSDYRLTDVHTTARFTELLRSGPDGLAAFFVDGADDPYQYLADAFGWDVEEVRWARRNRALLVPHTPEERLCEIEFLLKLVDVFATARRLGAGPSTIHAEVWSKLHRAHDPAAAASALRGLLERKAGAQEWAKLEGLLHDEVNVLKRDALVAAVAPGDGGSRDLFRRHYIDVAMGPQGTTSRVREAIAATQLYLHRYLLDLEEVALPARVDADEVRARIRTWWAWMKNYRLWEANRKVFVYPENYLRPELRAHKTPAFAALEEDLLQKEITAESVLAAYKRYLDEYTEVSRLTIAGGYVYTEDGADEDTRELVLFGRTRTEPRRYYYRSAEFRDAGGLSTTWEPWQRVDVAIEAEQVSPVHAFGRVFVFWPTVEVVAPKSAASTTVTTKQVDGGQAVSSPPPKYQVKISYSFRNLNGEWVAAQVLAFDAEQDGPVADVRLYVQASRTVPGGDRHDSIVVQCSYLAAGKRVTSAFTLTPELYGIRTTKTTAPAEPADLKWIFAEPVDPASIVRFNAPADTTDGTWVSVDHKGGSFLCRPVFSGEAARVESLANNTDNLPTTWDVTAGFELADGTRYYFDGPAGQYIVVQPDKQTSHQKRKYVNEKFGIVGTNLRRTGRVDAAVIRDESLYLFSGDEYYRFGNLDLRQGDLAEHRKLAGNERGFPAWSKVDGVFAGSHDKLVFCSRELEGYVVSGDLTTVRSFREKWKAPAGKKLDAVVHRDGRVYAVFGDQYVRISTADVNAVDNGYPRALANNNDGVPETTAGPTIAVGSTTFQFDNTASTCTIKVHTASVVVQTKQLGKKATRLEADGKVNAAYVSDGKLHLVTDTEHFRYTLNADGSIPEHADENYPKTPVAGVRGVIRRGDKHYVLTATQYGALGTNGEPSGAVELRPYAGNWNCLPSGFPKNLTGALTVSGKLFLLLGKDYAAYPTGAEVEMPCELSQLPVEIIRLTSSTAYELNRRLLVGGVDALLAPDTQELDELPGFSAAKSDATTIKVTATTAAAGVPVGSHLDFDSANGGYYWEIFFHAPMLIAQALNDAQRFDDARRWYEYVFDPTQRARYWRFLPFLAVDAHALVAGCRADLDALGSADVTSVLGPVLDVIDTMAPAFLGHRPLTTSETRYLAGAAATGIASVTEQLGKLKSTAAARLLDRVAMLGLLERQYKAMTGNRASLVAAYYDDPFDPHRIARLRPIAYRRTAVMAYIDNLLDWGDLLFRQHTAESVDEARMLYTFAYDLLGDRPYDTGPRVLPPVKDYDGLDGDEPDGDGESAVRHLTLNGALLQNTGAVHAGVANPYFYVPENSAFLEYWDRVEDRLRKIRASLDILGVSRPLPLFEPPVDVRALVRGAASGASADQVAAALAVPVPAYRFAFLHRKAQELADRCKQLGADLLAAFDRRDSEELALLQNRQESAVLELTRRIRLDQVEIAQANLRELQAALTGADTRVGYYEKLIDEGLTPLQEAQIAMMSLGSAAHFVASGLKIGAAIASSAPQVYLGPFILGSSYGGEQVGDALSLGSEISESLGEGFSVLGELLGVRADQERQAQDWRLQLATSRADVAQIGQQIAGAQLQVAVAQRELEVLDRQAAHLDEVGTFLTGKFAGAQLYHWMAGRLSGLYFQTYHTAYELARSAERAYRFERGGDDAFIQPSYWDSKHNGLLAAEGLTLDLDRLGQAHVTGDTRSFEITKRVSLLQLDPMALLALKNDGTCEFALTEELFDRDFPGHYRRQIRTVSVSFDTADGPVGVNATLTQLDSRIVLSADAKAVKYLLDPKGAQPESVRGDWRSSGQVALSDVESGRDNNGLFDLRFDDDRYLPFEGSGAVSRWRLEARGGLDVLDVTVTVKYTAEPGGESFATAVKGMLRPYPTARHFDVATAFPTEWAEFVEGDTTELLLPITPDRLPGIVGRRITGVYARYAVADGGEAGFALNGEPRLALDDGKLLGTPGLATGQWRLVFTGDKRKLDALTLILTYRAAVR
ncbi:hemopexin repeat-containing protein [Umezawaea endophytica]|uniref:Hemopexin repeat-containing protein n=1 Tax=Umezawaea endophytica TaxID=1654476 RepID=A0A9X2VKS2_9PSEU|nr:hemopexin repeat-containing protein [Umezawaea endophytica]MCS7477877.1 hemopexin repeat-containing protein [Umezawaea endophytica]